MCNVQDTRPAQMSAQTEQGLSEKQTTLLCIMPAEWGGLTRINLVTSVWVIHIQGGEVLFVHFCFLWEPCPIMGD